MYASPFPEPERGWLFYYRENTGIGMDKRRLFDIVFQYYVWE
jgi:hypothetical protein